MAAVQQLSGTIVVIIIAVGVQACIILFIFAKRQIQRFALRNRRGPHMSVGHGGPKALRREADKLLDYVQYIKHEPILEPLQADSQDFRRLIIINFQSFEYELANYSPYYIRPPCGNVRAHMLSCIHGPLMGSETRLVHQVCDDYNSARHHYEEIDVHKYQAFVGRLNILRSSLAANKVVKPNPSPLPPPPQSFSDSPRKRRGRGHTNSTSSAMGNNSGTYNRKSDTTNKRQTIQSKLSGISSGDNYNSSNFVNIAHDNSSFASPEALPSTSYKTSGNGETKFSSGTKNISESLDKPNNQPSGAISSIVSVETKHFGNAGNEQINSASV